MRTCFWIRPCQFEQMHQELEPWLNFLRWVQERGWWPYTAFSDAKGKSTEILLSMTMFLLCSVYRVNLGVEPSLSPSLYGKKPAVMLIPFGFSISLKLVWYQVNYLWNTKNRPAHRDTGWSQCELFLPSSSQSSSLAEGCLEVEGWTLRSVFQLKIRSLAQGAYPVQVEQ